jgi:hypothetical protein
MAQKPEMTPVDDDATNNVFSSVTNQTRLNEMSSKFGGRTPVRVSYIHL